MTANERARIVACADEWRVFATMLGWRVFVSGSAGAILTADNREHIYIGNHLRDAILSAISRASEEQ